MITKPQLIALDADDTLWANQPHFDQAEADLKAFLAQYGTPTELDEALRQVQIENLPLLGYGAKGFTLSMIEVAIKLTEGQVTGAAIQQIIDQGKKLLRFPIELLDGVEEVLDALTPQYSLMLLTKGDLLDQESKLARSGIGAYFSHVEIVSEKNEAAYQKILDRYGLQPAEFLMIGNSLKSDILPVAALGGQAIYIPYHTTWHIEQVTPPDTGIQYLQLDSLRDCLPLLLSE